MANTTGPSATWTVALLGFVHSSGLAGTMVVPHGAPPWP